MTDVETFSIKIKEFEEFIISHDLANNEIYLIAGFLLFAFLTVLIAKKHHIPIVVGYVFLGILLSPDIVSLIPFVDNDMKNLYTFMLSNLDYITQIALAFIAFTIGSELSIKTIKRLGKSIFYIVIFEATAAFGVVTLAMYLIGKPLYMALLFGAIASATAPAATVMVLREYNAEGPLTSTIMAVVGLDDAAALIIFSLINPIAYLRFKGGGVIHYREVFLTPLMEIFGAIIIGLTVGYIAQYFITKYTDKTKKILLIITSIIFSSAAAIYLNFSPLIANLAVGFSVRNFAVKNLQISDYLDTLTIPLYAMFFIIAGTEIRFSEMGSWAFLLVAFVYLTARLVGKIGGSTFAARISGAPEAVKKYIGLGLLPQSGVAIALAYSVQKQYVEGPDVGLLIFNTLLLTAAITEVFGPLLTKYALLKSGEGKIEESYQNNVN